MCCNSIQFFTKKKSIISRYRYIIIHYILTMSLALQLPRNSLSKKERNYNGDGEFITRNYVNVLRNLIIE